MDSNELGRHLGGNKLEEFGWACVGERHDDWNKLVDASNQQRLCGYSEWHVPDLYELTSLVDCSHGRWDIAGGCAGGLKGLNKDYNFVRLGRRES